MKCCKKIFVIFCLLLSLPINIFALDINVSGAGSGYGGAGTGTGNNFGKEPYVSIGYSIGFKATLYNHQTGGIKGYRYYIRKRWMTSKMPTHNLLYGDSIYRGNCVNGNGNAGINSYTGTLDSVCGGTFSNAFTCELVNDWNSKFVGFLEPTWQHAGPMIEIPDEPEEKKFHYCNVSEDDDGLMSGNLDFTNCVYITKPGVGEGKDVGINFQAGNLVKYLSHSDINKEDSFISLMIKYLYGKSSINDIGPSDVANDYIIIEPLYAYQVNKVEYVSTIKDIYIKAINTGRSEYSANGSGHVELGSPNWFIDAMGTVYAGYDNKITGYYFGQQFTFGNAACWYHGLGAIYIDMSTLGEPSCSSDQCCFDKVSDNQYKYNVAHSTDDGSWQHYNKYKLKNPNNSSFVNDENQISETYTNGNPFPEPDSTFEKCGCDQTDPDMCCYKYNESTRKYEYDHTANSKTYDHYQHFDTDADGNIIGTMPTPDDDTQNPGIFVSCGCDPETQCCYDSTGTKHPEYQDPGYGVAGRYSMNNGKLTPCFCASRPGSNGSCGGKATKKQVYADDDELACLANFDSSGKSRSNVPGAYYNNEVGCEFEYEVSYPQPSPKPTAESGKKLQLVTGPLVTVKVTRKCVSTNKSKLEALTAKPTIAFSSKKFKYDDQSMLGLTSSQTFDLYTRDDKTESGKSFEYQSENVGTTINEGDYFLRVYTYTYNYYIPYLEYDSTEGVAKILSTERPEENNEFWINKLPIPYNAKSKTGKDYTRYISMNIKQNGSNNLSYSDGGITCNYNVTDANKVKFFYRVIDLDNMNKLGRTLGYNWSDTRGQTVKTAVEKTGNYANLTNGNNGIFSFTLDPATMVMIRNYNKKESQGNHGGYNDGDRLTETKEGVNGCHYHWYSPFLYCLYYGNDGTNCDISTSVDVSGCSVKFKNNDNLKNTFDNYTSISKPNGGGFDQYDFETNMGNLIKKQHNLG